MGAEPCRADLAGDPGAVCPIGRQLIHIHDFDRDVLRHGNSKQDVAWGNIPSAGMNAGLLPANRQDRPDASLARANGQERAVRLRRSSRDGG